jgi:hypothetical protein
LIHARGATFWYASWTAAISSGEPLTGFDPEISEWDNPRRDYLPSDGEFIAIGSELGGDEPGGDRRLRPTGEHPGRRHHRRCGREGCTSRTANRAQATKPDGLPPGVGGNSDDQRVATSGLRCAGRETGIARQSLGSDGRCG